VGVASFGHLRYFLEVATKAQFQVLDLFNSGEVSLGRAAELCRMPVATFIDFAAGHGVYPLRYGAEDLDEERAAIDRLNSDLRRQTGETSDG
jgi:hypothetical protein